MFSDVLDCRCPVAALPHIDVGWSTLCDCGIFLSQYFFKIFCHFHTIMHLFSNVLYKD